MNRIILTIASGALLALTACAGSSEPPRQGTEAPAAAAEPKAAEQPDQPAEAGLKEVTLAVTGMT